MTTRSLKLFLKVLCCVVASTAALPAYAGTRTWDGTANGNWFDTARWAPGGDYPRAGDTVLVQSGSVLLTNSTEYLGSFTITNATLTFTNWATALSATNVAVLKNGLVTHAACNTNPVLSNSRVPLC